MRMRTLMFSLLACIGLMVPGYVQSQNSLIESLGFNVPCEGATQPTCSQPLSTVNTGSCYIYVCNDGVPVGTDGQVCPVYGDCLANETRVVSTDPNGCPRVTCTANTGCVSIEQIQCPATQLAVASGNIDDAGCPIFSCQLDPNIVSNPNPETCETPNADGTCPDKEETCRQLADDGKTCLDDVVCEAPPVCPTGFVVADKGKDDKGCDIQTCEQKVCPQIANCPKGYTSSIEMVDGCKKLKCTKVDGTDGKSCPEQMNCPTGYKRVDGQTTASGCPTFTCEKITGSDKDDKTKDDKTFDPTKPLIVEAECRGSMNKECEGKVQCPAGLYAYHIKGACNTKWGSVSDAELKAVPMGTLAVVKPSSQPAGSMCKIAGNNIQYGNDRMNRDHIIQDPTKPIKFACRDFDKNGGECHIRVAVQCLPASQYWAHTQK